jgi:hypothetical protein
MKAAYMRIASYSPTDVSVLLGGFHQITGFISGSFVSISKDVQPFKTTRTADGETARIHVKDSTFTITIKLASTSPTNTILTKLYQVDELTQKGKVPLFVKDSLGSSLFLAPTCWVKEVPDLEFSDAVTERTWVLQGANGVVNYGGNIDDSSVLEDFASVALGGIGSFL